TTAVTSAAALLDLQHGVGPRFLRMPVTGRNHWNASLTGNASACHSLASFGRPHRSNLLSTATLLRLFKVVDKTSQAFQSLDGHRTVLFLLKAPDLFVRPLHGNPGFAELVHQFGTNFREFFVPHQ